LDGCLQGEVYPQGFSAMSLIGSGDMSASECEIHACLVRSAALKDKVREYLRLGSCDGRIERKALRRELAALIGVEYDEKESRIK